MPSTFVPGSVTGGFLPGQQPTMNLPLWQQTVVAALARNLKTPGYDGKPASWDEGRLGSWQQVQSEFQHGEPTFGTQARLFDFVQNYLPQNGDDLGWATQVAGSPPSPTDNDWQLTPEQLAENADRAMSMRKQDFTEAKYAIDLAASQATRVSSGGGGSSARASNPYASYPGAGSTAQDDADARADRALDLQEAYQKGQLNLQQLQLELQKLQFAEGQRQFNQNYELNLQTLAQQRQDAADQRNLNRATIVSKLQSDPGDAVARDYMLHSMGQPQGQRTDIFTGNISGGPATLSELLKEQAQQVPGNPLPQAVPAMAHGTEHDWVPVSKFISGDPQVPNKPNPELVELRSAAPIEGRITPLNEIADAPKFAGGTRWVPGAMTGDPSQDYTDFSGKSAISPALSSQLYGPVPMKGVTKAQMEAGNGPVGQQGGYGTTYAQTGKDANGNIQFGWLDASGNQTGRMDLTGAQVSQGVTQDYNPGGPNYVAPPPLALPPGQTVDYGQEDDVRMNGQPVAGQPQRPLLAQRDPMTGVTLEAPNESGYQRVVGGQPLEVKVGLGGHVSLAGDGTEIKGPDGNYYRWNTETNRYDPIIVVPTIISSAQQFYSLPPEVQQAILTNRDKTFMLNDSGIDPRATGLAIEQVLAKNGIDPKSMTQAEKLAFVGQNPAMFQGLDILRAYPSGWVKDVTNPRQMTFARPMSASEFLAGTPQEQMFNLQNGPMQQRAFNPGSTPSLRWSPRFGTQVQGFELPQTETWEEPFDYGSYYKDGYLPPSVASLIYGG